jgi:trypsin-like peptidase
MPLKPPELEELTKLIADEVPPRLFAQVVEEQGIDTDFDNRAKAGPEDAAGRIRRLVGEVLAVYDRAGLVHRLIDPLCRNMEWNTIFVAKAGAYSIPEGAAADVRQAFLARRDNLLVSETLHRYCTEFEPRVCCLAGRVDVVGGDPPDFSSGTGVLVGSDLVLTTMHLFDPVVAAGKGAEVPDRFVVFFDHVDGEPIGDPTRLNIAARRVKLHAQWLVAHADPMDDDGQIEHPTPAQVALLKTKLDFALVRLAEPVGLQAITKGGGRLRLWVDPPEPAVPATLRPDHRILITQHPFGSIRLVDLGRFVGLCDSETRIRYTTSTEKGSSGAPCFNKDLALVGMHNAEYKPNGVRNTNSNQAVRFDHILALIAPHLSRRAAGEQQTTRIWNVSSPAAPTRVVLGRGTFIDWIDRAASEAVTSRRERLYAAVGPTGAGKTFSIEVLRAARRDRAEPTVVIGTNHELLPSKLEDVVAVIADQLRLLPDDLLTLPVRPSADLPQGAADGDKLRKWASEVVPQWFAGVLERHRERTEDRRDAARRIVAQYETLGQKVPDDVQALAEGPASLTKPYQWPMAWVVLDRLANTVMSAEVKDLIAGLVGGVLDDAAVSPALRRLRWLFLGYRPDFVKDGDIVVEMLDPDQFKAADVVDCIHRVYAARGDEARPFLEGVTRTIDAFERMVPLLKDSEHRLETLQKLAGLLVEKETQ